MKRDRRRRAQRRKAGLGDKKRGTFMETRRRGGKMAPVGRGTGGVGEARGRQWGGVRAASVMRGVDEDKGWRRWGSWLDAFEDDVGVGSVGWMGMTWMSERAENGTENKVSYDD
jgi:hypothetical protein